jgi:hypothetical protein
MPVISSWEFVEWPSLSVRTRGMWDALNDLGPVAADLFRRQCISRHIRRRTDEARS